MRIHVGAGYRIYLARTGKIVLLLLCGGDKSSQVRDIARAKRLLAELGKEWVMARVTEFDASAYLVDDEVVAEYLTAALEDPNPDVFLAAVGNVAKARGMSAIAESSGLGRESLYKALTPGAKPRYDTVLKVLQSLGVKISVSAA
jgi:probable addiction module antidote protein